MKEAPALLTTADAAARIGIHRDTLCKWAVTRADVRACRFSRGWWRTADLDRLMGVVRK